MHIRQIPDEGVVVEVDWELHYRNLMGKDIQGVHIRRTKDEGVVVEVDWDLN